MPAAPGVGGAAWAPRAPRRSGRSRTGRQGLRPGDLDVAFGEAVLFGLCDTQTLPGFREQREAEKHRLSVVSLPLPPLGTALKWLSALAGVAPWREHRPRDRRAPGLVPVGGHVPGLQAPSPAWALAGACTGGHQPTCLSHVDVSPSFFWVKISGENSLG